MACPREPLVTEDREGHAKSGPEDQAQVRIEALAEITGPR
jgi:hypothetical protein